MKVRVRAASILPQASPRASFSAVFAVRADVPFAARCFAAVFLAGCSADGVAHTESIIAPQLARVAPYGITFYDRERAELGGCDAYHAFVSTDEHARHLFFHCWTRKTPMPLGTHRAALLRSQLMVHALHVPMDDDVPHLLAALPLFDTTVLVVVTSTCSMTTMRRAMTAYAESVPAGTPFAAGDCDALFGQLCSVQQVAFALQNVGASLQFVPIPEKAGAGSEEKGDDVREDYDSEGRPSHSLSLPCLHVARRPWFSRPRIGTAGKVCPRVAAATRGRSLHAHAHGVALPVVAPPLPPRRLAVETVLHTGAHAARRATCVLTWRALAASVCWWRPAPLPSLGTTLTSPSSCPSSTPATSSSSLSPSCATAWYALACCVYLFSAVLLLFAKGFRHGAALSASVPTTGPHTQRGLGHSGRGH